MNSKHEWKPGDRFEGEVTGLDKYGDLIVGPPGMGQLRRRIHPDAVTPIPDYSEWIGKPANELPKLPKWTVCDVDTGMWVTRAIWTGEKLCWVKADDSPSAQMSTCNYPVVRIHKLGEVRPKTLGDEEPGVVWREPDNTLHWQDNYGQWCYCDSAKGIPHTNHFDDNQAYSAAACEIGPDWTRLGPIEGMKIGGVVYGEGE